MNYKPHTHCRACGSTDLFPVFDLGTQPLANDFRKPGESPALRFPLTVLFCPQCTLAQLSVVVSPELLYSHYAYMTPNVQTNRDHFEQLIAALVRENGTGSVVEIGSNDGTFLCHLRNAGFKSLLGVDPAANACQHARDRWGLNVIPAFFRKDTAETVFELAGRKVDLVVARHVFCHVDDWRDFVAGLEILCNPNTLVAIEVPSVAKLIAKLEWDTVYHEHLSYLSKEAMVALLKGTSLKLHGIVEFPVHGGSAVFLLRHRNSEISAAHLEAPVSANQRDWETFAIAAKSNRESLQEYVGALAADKATVVGYGAPAKATVVINACGWDTNTLKWVTDTTPEKLGRLVPGTQIPVVPDERLLAEQPDFAVLFPWNYAAEIRQAKVEYLRRGGSFIQRL